MNEQVIASAYYVTVLDGTRSASQRCERRRVPARAEQLSCGHVVHGTREIPMKALIATIAFAAMSGSVIAQNAGPAPQSGMERPENTNGATERGAMDTTGMNAKPADQPGMKDASKAETSKDENRTDGKKK
ncbi:hypothetical protein JJB98_17045 [Bradyrhizobium diazoefficiens]|nr:hypothetical protein [Bradyrhizobium diazoefficiens]QQO21521.1 hypothetical protein JJB98_17045 [Bradyrhizobium diazoefficiens]